MRNKEVIEVDDSVLRIIGARRVELLGRMGDHLKRSEPPKEISDRFIFFQRRVRKNESIISRFKRKLRNP